MEPSKIRISWEDLERQDAYPRSGGLTPVGGNANRGKPSWRGRHWLWAVALGGVLIVLVVLMWSWRTQQEYRQSILRVLKDERAIAQAMGKTSSASEMFATCRQELKRIDLSGCPDEFASAFYVYQDAFEDLAPIIQRLDERNSFTSYADSFLSAFFKGMIGRFDLILEDIDSELAADEQLRAQGGQLVKNIDVRYGDVLRIAERYGVDVSGFKK